MIPMEHEIGKVEEKKVSVAEKLKLIKVFKKLTCAKCSGEAYFVPTHNKVVCPKCNNVKETDPSSTNPRDYMTDASLKEFDAGPVGSRYVVAYQSPDSFALKDAPGRNEPCSCGSGIKYKKCCMSSAEAERNKAVVALYTKQKESALIAGANVVRMINMAIAYFKENPESKEVEAEALGFKPFKNMQGETEDVSVFDVKVDS